MADDNDRRKGSTILGAVMGGALILLGILLLSRGKAEICWEPIAPWVNGLSSLLFGLVLLLWAIFSKLRFSEQKGVFGNPTVVMVVAVVAGMVAVLTLTDGAVANSKKNPACLSKNEDAAPKESDAERYSIYLGAVHPTRAGQLAHTYLVDRRLGKVWQEVCDTKGLVSFAPVEVKGLSSAAPANTAP